MDLRIIEYESEFYIHHGVLGPKIPLILEDIFNFLSDDKVTHELVIVAASNMRQMDDNSHAKFMDLVENTLGKFLFQNGGNYESLLHTTRLQDIVDQGPKILFIYDDKYLDKHPNPSFFPKEVIYSHWSNTTSMKDLIKDQLKDHSSRLDSLFELQWLFTTQVANGTQDVLAQLDVVEDKFIHSLHSLSYTPGILRTLSFSLNTRSTSLLSISLKKQMWLNCALNAVSISDVQLYTELHSYIATSRICIIIIKNLPDWLL